MKEKGIFHFFLFWYKLLILWRCFLLVLFLGVRYFFSFIIFSIFLAVFFYLEVFFNFFGIFSGFWIFFGTFFCITFFLYFFVQFFRSLFRMDKCFFFCIKNFADANVSKKPNFSLIIIFANFEKLLLQKLRRGYFHLLWH